MPKDYSPLLDLLIVSRPGREHDRDRFKAALLTLDLYSVFDIIRLSRNDFIDRLAQYCDDDGGEAYDNAVGYASQIELLARDPSSLDDDTLRNRRSAITDPRAPPTYATLFPGNGRHFAPHPLWPPSIHPLLICVRFICLRCSLSKQAKALKKK